MGLAENIGAGAAAGAAGALAMAGVMELGKEAGIIRRPYPAIVEQHAARELGVARSTGPRADKAATWGGHLAIGAAWGAVYGALQTAMGFGAIPAGPLYGAAVYAVDMMGIGPALGLDRGPWNVPASTAGERLAMHLLYGAVLGLSYPRIQQALGGGQGQDQGQGQSQQPWQAQPRLLPRNWHTPTNAPFTSRPDAERYGTVGAAAQAEVSQRDAGLAQG